MVKPKTAYEGSDEEPGKSGPVVQDFRGAEPEKEDTVLFPEIERFIQDKYLGDKKLPDTFLEFMKVMKDGDEEIAIALHRAAMSGRIEHLGSDYFVFKGESDDFVAYPLPQILFVHVYNPELQAKLLERRMFEEREQQQAQQQQYFQQLQVEAAIKAQAENDARSHFAQERAANLQGNLSSALRQRATPQQDQPSIEEMAERNLSIAGQNSMGDNK